MPDSKDSSDSSNSNYSSYDNSGYDKLNEIKTKEMEKLLKAAREKGEKVNFTKLYSVLK